LPKRDEKNPEDFAEPSDKFKLSLLNMEKRFVDLEVTISELNERLKTGNVEPIQALGQRIEDIEDLILVEQAGLMELKKAMESAENKFQTTIGFDEKLEGRLEGKFDEKLGRTLGEVEKKITGVEKKISDAERKLTDTEKKIADNEEKIADAEEIAKDAAKKAEEPSELKEETNERISLIEREIAELKTRPPTEEVSPLEIGELRNRLQTLDKRLSSFESSVGALKASIEVKIKDSVEEALKGETGKGVDFEFIKARMDSLKEGVDTLSDKRAEADSKLGEMEEKVSLLDSRLREMPKTTFDEMKETKGGLETAKIRLESVERVVRELAANMNDMENKAKSFESLEKLTNLKKEVDDKLRRFKFIEEEIGKLSSRVELIYSDLDKRLMGMRNQEKDIRRLSDGMSEFVKDLGQVRIDIKSRVERREIGKLSQTVEENARYVDDVGKIAKSMSESLSHNFEDLRKDIEQMRNDVQEVRGDVQQVRSDVQDRMEKKEVGKVVGKILSGVEESIKRSESGGNFEIIRKEVENVNRGLSELEEVKKNLAETRNELRKTVRESSSGELPEGFKVVVSDLGSRISKIEKVVEMMQSSIVELSEKLQEPMYDVRMKELVDKFIFLESRLSAMESVLQRTQPIILE